MPDIHIGQIPVVIAFTPDYLVTAATFISSLLACSSDHDRFRIICLITEDLKDDTKKQLNILGERAEFVFVNASGLLKDIYVNPVFTEAASYRLLLPEILFDYDKVLYMDCDIIVQNNMAELYRSVELGTNYLAAVYEAILDFQEDHVKSLGCYPGSYFNSGVLVMNLAQMRNDEMVSVFLKASKEPSLRFPDQDVLNRYCKDRTIGLAPYYNAVRTFFLPQYKSDFLKYYNESDWISVQNHGNLHYTGGKPWNTFTVKFEEWWIYYENLPRALKQSALVNKKMYYFYKIYRMKIIRSIVENIQNLYRRVKNRG